MAEKLKLEFDQTQVQNLQVFLARLIEKPEAPRFTTPVIESSVLQMMQEIERQTGVGLDPDMPGEVSTVPKRESKIEGCSHIPTARGRCALCGEDVGPGVHSDR